MFDLIRDSTAGQLIRFISGRRVLLYPDEKPDWQSPDRAEQDLLVDWYDEDDGENPQNWSFPKKLSVALLINLYTFVVYGGSSIYVASMGGVMETFNVSYTAASLGLAIYVLGYGLGPLLFSPLSEIPSVGRNLPYIVTFGIFVILCAPTATVDNFGGLIALRFLQGYFGSPCLATGAASMGDMFSLVKLPIAIAFWSVCAVAGPAMGPLLSGYSVPAMGWRWSLWEMLWSSGPVWVAFFFLVPETYSDTILLRRAVRLRRLTGNKQLKSQSEVKQGNPAITYTAIYTSLVYGIYYSFFEAFPLVYPVIYGFSLGEMGLVFLSVLIGVIISLAIYCFYILAIWVPTLKSKGPITPEMCLIPALYACFIPPIGLFIFGWTARSSIHWMVSVTGIAIYNIGMFMMMQCLFMYLAFTYPQYAASLFAGNDAARSLLAAAAVLFAHPLYKNLGIGPGISILGAVTVAFIGGIFPLYFFGAKLRARSRFAVK
ncbi:hypothetical protein VE01_09558 [Pseudogymnoascus verrucosus]|uniref:Major facilitator superfamily (MFS) profile domain-containing protein n=1 Tax=Pseudogymnoascus verrucosus TaxID=342668 RepID=A0A1B8G9G1_9PEZI|nr:uncharacterized protein VE01_09558 [Pseudogymnoascus verrucosus]OBT92468.2 hypothetical protein VE01_09558 [Pseudogymnoascus verrucosus]